MNTLWCIVNINIVLKNLFTRSQIHHILSFTLVFILFHKGQKYLHIVVVECQML
jgi:hypothetical protein